MEKGTLLIAGIVIVIVFLLVALIYELIGREPSKVEKNIIGIGIAIGAFLISYNIFDLF